MKRRFLLMMSILCLTFTHGFAQTEQSTQAVRKARPNTLYGKHNFRLSMGVGGNFSYTRPLTSIFLNNSLGADYYYSKIADYATYTPDMSLEYTYAVSRVFHLGARASFVSQRQMAYYRPTSTLNYVASDSYVMFTPLARFYYFQRGIVKLYGDVSAGIALATHTTKEKGSNAVRTYNTHFAGQVNYFGISLGSKLYGFANLGFGNQGIFSAGIGYQFN